MEEARKRDGSATEDLSGEDILAWLSAEDDTVSQLMELLDGDDDEDAAEKSSVRFVEGPILVAAGLSVVVRNHQRKRGELRVVVLGLGLLGHGRDWEVGGGRSRVGVKRSGGWGDKGFGGRR
jgi:hypothetical protein